MQPCLTLSIIRYGSRVKWSNPGKGIAPSPAPQCSSYCKGNLRVTLDYSHQLYFTLYALLYFIYIIYIQFLFYLGITFFFNLTIPYLLNIYWGFLFFFKVELRLYILTFWHWRLNLANI